MAASRQLGRTTFNDDGYQKIAPTSPLAAMARQKRFPMMPKGHSDGADVKTCVSQLEVLDRIGTAATDLTETHPDALTMQDL